MYVAVTLQVIPTHTSVRESRLCGKRAESLPVLAHEETPECQRGVFRS